MKKAAMGRLPDGREVFRYTLENASGAYAEISTLGGCLLSLAVPDRTGAPGDVLLGYDTVEAMRAAKGYMGMLVGRFANRIGGASFDLGGKMYLLAKNDGENHLHGGLIGYDKHVWQARAQGDSLALSLHSPDGDEGYPGALDIAVVYTLTEQNTLRIRYTATADQDTIINLTCHAYFNLSGPKCPSIENHRVQIHADAITSVSSRACIPDGKLYLVDKTPFDLRSMRALKEGFARQDEDIQMRYGNGYDHNFVIRGWDKTLRQAVLVEDPASGRRMETWTDQPGVQFYSGNGISPDIPGKLGAPYRPRQGFCLETQHFPDSVHHPQFPSCVLRAGEIYDTTTEYRFPTPA